MVTSDKFYEVFHHCDEQLTKAGFKSSARNTYRSKNGVALKLVLNSWGWTPDEGWGFLVRLVDTAAPSDGHPYQPSFDIRPLPLVTDGYLEKKDIDAAYGAYAVSKPKMLETLEQGWFAFYDSEHLKLILNVFMPAIAKAAADWDKKRIEERKKPRPPFRKRTPEEIQAIKEQAEIELRAAGLKVELPEDQE